MLARAPQVAYLHNLADDAGRRMPDGWCDAGVDVALAAPEDPSTKVLAHGHMCINRGPSWRISLCRPGGGTRWRPATAFVGPGRSPTFWCAEDAVYWWRRRTQADSQGRVIERGALARRRERTPSTWWPSFAKSGRRRPCDGIAHLDGKVDRLFGIGKRGAA